MEQTTAWQMNAAVVPFCLVEQSQSGRMRSNG